MYECYIFAYLWVAISKPMRKVLFVILVFLCPLALRAQRCIILTVEDGLCSSNVNSLYQDRHGDIWIATENGLSRYDGLNVHTYKHDPADPHSLAYNIVRSFAEDGQGRLLVAGESGVQYYDSSTDSFSIVLANESGETYTSIVNHMLAVDDRTVWLSGNDLQQLTTGADGEPVLSQLHIPIPTRMTGTLQLGEDGTVWCGRHGDGIYKMSPDGSWAHYTPECFEDLFVTISNPVDGLVYASDHSGNICHYDAEKDCFVPDDFAGLKGVSILCILNTGDGRIMFCTDGLGVRVLDYATGEWSLLQAESIPCDPATLSVHFIIKDSAGNLWLAAYQQGVIMIPARDVAFHYIGNRSFVSNVIGSMPVTSLLAEPDGKLWVGTQGDGLFLLDDNHTQLKHFKVEDGFPNAIYDIKKDRDGQLWFGSFARGLWRLDPERERLVNTTELNKEDRSVDLPRSIEIDGSGRIWIGAMGYGLFCYDPVLGRTERVETQNEFVNPRVSDLLIRGNNLYVATSKGIFHLDISIAPLSVSHHVLPETQVYCLASDGNNLYAGTIDGLAIIDPATFETSMLTVDDGLPDNMVLSIEIGQEGELWISTISRLVRFNPRSRSVRHSDDDMLVEEFLRKVSAAGPDGRLYFGGTEGITYFKPSDIYVPSNLPQAKIVSFSVPGRKVPLGEDGYYVLDHTEHTCTISFTTTEFISTSSVRFCYSVDGRDWTVLERGQTSITLGNLKPGRSTFRVKTDFGGVDTEPASISIRVLPSRWSSGAAVAFYLLAGLLLLGGISLLVIRLLKGRREIARYAREQSIKEDKLRFFQNLSHEIRSPMTLVKAPLQKLIESDSDPERQRSYAAIGQNADSVIQLLDQSLVICKAEEGAIKLSFAPVGLVHSVSGICDLFRPQAELNRQKLVFRYACSRDLEVWMDQSFFNKVITNLLSNALRYTPAGGNIAVTVSAGADSASVEVRNSGKPLDEENLQTIFDLFYQGHDAVSGAGVGLYFAKVITELHHGTIRASNSPEDGGPVFTVTLPLGNAHLSNDQITGDSASAAPDIELPLSLHPVEEDVPENRGRKKHTLLLTDDNNEIRRWLASELSIDYRVLEAANGKEAYHLALSEHPDILVSDVIMPVMDGFELCEKVRKNPNISSMPIILVTARSLDQDRIEGLAAGADAYLTKPFNLNVLKTTAENLIKGRERLKVTLAEPRVDESDIREMDIKTPDDRLLDRVVRIVNEHLGDPELTVEQVAAEAGISRVHLHRKLKELTGQTSRDFIRNLRLRKAAEMLSGKKYAISELADAVGFQSASSFATAFKDLFGVSPSEYGQQNKSM